MTDENNKLGNLATALSKAQATLKHPLKTKTVRTPQFTYKYADLSDVIDSVRGAFAENGLSFVQSPNVSVIDKTITLTTILLHASGQSISSNLTMGLPDLKPQSVGSAITYARRYALSALAGIAADEDDDAQIAQGVSK